MCSSSDKKYGKWVSKIRAGPFLGTLFFPKRTIPCCGWVGVGSGQVAVCLAHPLRLTASSSGNMFLLISVTFLNAPYQINNE